MRRTTRRPSGSRRSAPCICSTMAGTRCASRSSPIRRSSASSRRTPSSRPGRDDLLKKWDNSTPDEKKMFVRQADVYAAYLAYTDHEIGRVIQAVEDMGKLDNTLIIYISGDNGAQRRGHADRHAERGRLLQRRRRPGRGSAQDFYDVWGSDKTYPHMAVAWTWAFDTPFKWTKQVASHFGGTRQGMAIAWPDAHQGRGRHPPPVPSRHRHRADDPRGRRHPRPRHGERHRAEADRGREHGLHLRQGQCRRAIDAHARSTSR